MLSIDLGMGISVMVGFGCNTLPTELETLFLSAIGFLPLVIDSRLARELGADDAALGLRWDWTPFQPPSAEANTGALEAFDVRQRPGRGGGGRGARCCLYRNRHDGLSVRLGDRPYMPPPLPADERPPRSRN